LIMVTFCFQGNSKRQQRDRLVTPRQFLPVECLRMDWKII